MPHPDLTASAARSLLSAPADARDDALLVNGWSRRRFLQAVAGGVGAGIALEVLGPQLLGTDVPEACAGSPIGGNDGILVHILLYGGSDWFNVVVPYTNGLYYDWRSTGTSIPARSVLPLDGSFGLHPSLPSVKALWDAGQVGIVHGVGYQPADLSHFSSMAIWMNGSFGLSPSTGWLGRWLDGQPAGQDLAVTTVGTSVPLHVTGSSRRAVAIPEAGGLLGTRADPDALRTYVALNAMSAAPSGRGPWHDAFAGTLRSTISVAGQLAPAFTPTVTGGPFVKKLTMAARLINRNIGMRVIDVGVGSFDHHDGQPYRLNALLQDLDAGIVAFFATLDPAYLNRVTLITTSEFGRTIQGNNSQGTDHGTANAHLVIGPNVRGGMYGASPNLPAKTTGNQWTRLTPTVDFRSVFGSVVDGWLGGGGTTILGGGYSAIDLFRQGPGVGSTAPPIFPPPASAPAEYVPLSPRRIVDTRSGTGGRSGPMGTNETWSFTAGGGEVPMDAIAVAMNVTSVDASGPTFFTLWAAGTAQPSTSNLNPVPGVAVPNLVVSRLGVGGQVSLYNLQHSVHAVVDVVGYFRDGSSNGLLALPPARCLDTRDGTGGVVGKVGPEGVVELQVAGFGEVPPDATAVALNVTVTDPDSASFLTVYPTGEERQTTSSVNMRGGQTVANMVIAKVGAGGKVSIYNYAGSTHVVVDVLGSFVAGAGGRFIAVGPNRLVDTRNGTGASGRVGQAPLRVQVAGLAGVPASGASSVLINVTVVAPSVNTFATVYPSDRDLPKASNVNALGGDVVPNMALARLGADGAINVFNGFGDTDLVIDVFGYWTS